MKRILGLILIILTILGSVNFVKRMAETGGEIKPTGNAAYDSGQRFGQILVPVVLGAMGLVGLFWLFGASDYRPAPPPPPDRRFASARRPPPRHESLRGGQDTFASNPALLRLSAVQWLAANPIVLIASGVLASIGFVVLFIKLPLGIVLLVTAVIVLFLQVREVKQKFYAGDVCPGVVLSAQKNLVAVFTDLNASSRVAQPAIRILKQPLRRMRTERAYDGMRVATVALYHGDVRQPAWKNFSPEVINCVVHDPQEIARVLGSITEMEWQSLDTHLAEIPGANPGLYRLSGPRFSPPDEMDLSPPKPWYRTTLAVITFSVVGAVFGGFVLLKAAGVALRGITHSPAPGHRTGPIAAPRRADGPQPGEPTSTGPYKVGSRVQALWIQKWVPGQITSIKPGGFVVMVQLEDSHFPIPVLLSTNQIRPK